MSLLHVSLNTPSPQGLPKLNKRSWAASLGGKARVPGRQGRRLAVLPIQSSVTIKGGNGPAKSTVLLEPETASTVPTSETLGKSGFPPGFVASTDTTSESTLGRSDFPPGFVFGAASSAYQVEGAWNEGGKGENIWDHFTHNYPDKIKDKSTGDIATDSYNRYQEDTEILKKMGVDSYRFSISWSRILPKGNLEGGVNEEGIKYYNDLINDLRGKGLKPFITLFHWDVPQALEEAYGGFLDRRIVDDFKDFAEICFREFGDRVQHWITLNEPWTFSSAGYSLGKHAPRRCSQILGCPVGDSLTEPYIVTHNLILAHAAAASLYKDKYQAKQNGEIGITLVSMWFEPLNLDSPPDKEAANRYVDSMIGWYMDPLAFGDYPHSIRALVRERLPHFTREESAMIKGSYDFIGINYYTSRYIENVSLIREPKPAISIIESYGNQHAADSHAGELIGEKHSDWLYAYPNGMRDLLKYTKERYKNPKIYITENGTCQVDHPPLTLEQILDDEKRSKYLADHLAQVWQAIQEGIRVQGYFVWSVTDNFEWDEGYTSRFGLVYIDYADNLKRIPKASAEWYTRFLHN